VLVDLIVQLCGGQPEVRQGVGGGSAVDQGESHAQVGNVDGGLMVSDGLGAAVLQGGFAAPREGDVAGGHFRVGRI
jgi:hypothetical protein